ncbi:Ribbon-helix-helix protein, copG family [Xenococcus sp. PCC 7305]|uniref:hypothetical protein n=1 Tax=Xenococcus sp. PCC 7305 TaxID=102125 RepID=UPI0002ABEC3D|nr:hypothetical protein [Xenococcus sp. PCC 7305]ELS04927.1 Ribbon-helix-helix protein, copG family [Xenococcus sp. PCC 7305]
MNKDYYNRVQIYLPPETKAKFSELCKAKGQTKSEVGKFIFAEYFRLTESVLSPTNSVQTRTDSVQSQLNDLRGKIAELELKMDSVLEANSVMTRTDSVSKGEPFVSGTLINEPFRENLEEQKDLSQEKQEFSTEDRNKDDSLSTKKRQDWDLTPLPANNFLMGRAPLPEKSPQSAIKKAETKVQNSVSCTPKVKPVIPKDIQALNESGGIEIPEDGNFGHDIIDKYLFPVLKGRHILYGIDKQHMHYWISGGNHIKVTEDYLLAKLYHSESRMKIAIPKLEKKFSLRITPMSATDFIRELSRPERGQILTNWGIKYSFIG